MSKAIVIKGADFTVNKLATITFDGVHTESVSVLPASIGATEIGATYSISASLVPSDSVDPVVWTTSNANVANVSDGQVTITGCGTCTITATSGSYSATCALTVIVPLTTGFSKSYCTTIVAPTDTNDITTVNTYKDTKDWLSNTLAIYDEDNTKQRMPLPYNYVNNSVSPYAYKTDEQIMDSQPANHGIFWPVPIVLPHNCTKIKFKQLSSDYGVYPLFFKKDVGSSYQLTPMRKQEYKLANYPFTYETETIINVPAGYDSFTATWKVKPDSGATVFTEMSETDLAKFAVEFM